MRSCRVVLLAAAAFFASAAAADADQSSSTRLRSVASGAKAMDGAAMDDARPRLQEDAQVVDGSGEERGGGPGGELWAEIASVVRGSAKIAPLADGLPLEAMEKILSDINVQRNTFEYWNKIFGPYYGYENVFGANFESKEAKQIIERYETFNAQS